MISQNPRHNERDLVKDKKGEGEEHLGEDVRSGGEESGDEEHHHQHVAAGAGELLVRDDPKPGEQGQDNRYLKEDPKGEEHPGDEPQILAHPGEEDDVGPGQLYGTQQWGLPDMAMQGLSNIFLV